jgi:hypothetical protein
MSTLLNPPIARRHEKLRETGRRRGPDAPKPQPVEPGCCGAREDCGTVAPCRETAMGQRDHRRGCNRRRRRRVREPSSIKCVPPRLFPLYHGSYAVTVLGIDVGSSPPSPTRPSSGRTTLLASRQV